MTGRAPSFARVGALSWFALASILGTPSGARDKGPAVKAFDITASRYRYDPPVMEVTEGDEVRLTLHSADGTHGFAIKELKVKVTVPKGGATVSTGFLASRAGTFDVTCSEYCGSGHRDMKARLVVDPRGTR